MDSAESEASDVDRAADLFMIGTGDLIDGTAVQTIIPDDLGFVIRKNDKRFGDAGVKGIQTLQKMVQVWISAVKGRGKTSEFFGVGFGDHSSSLFISSVTRITTFPSGSFSA